MPSAAVDNVVRWLQLIFIDGKFYTIFSMLFGIGFSIIISNAQKRGSSGIRVFYRRMFFLALFGLAHLLLVWSGDILLLYALLGMLLPPLSRLSDSKLLTIAGVLLLRPIAVDAVAEICGITLGAGLTRIQWHYCGLSGITEENFASWLRDAKDYSGVWDFLRQGAFERMWEFVSGNRYFKVMGLFIIGFWIGRNRLYANLEKNKPLLKRIARIGIIVGLPMSMAYAWSAFHGQPMGTTAHTVLYTFSVYPLGFAYVALLSLWFNGHRNLGLWKTLAAPGRMAMTCYLCQSLIGMFLFYGIGLGLGTHCGRAFRELIACGVFLVAIGLCHLWLNHFRFGPFEWIWRMLTYGKYLPLRNKA